MKPQNLTNEQLAAELLEPLPHTWAVKEAARRLQNKEPRIMDDHADIMEKTFPAVRAFLDDYIIQEMAESHGSFGPTETCFPIRSFVNEWVTADMVRAVVRDLTDRGLCRYACGLFNECGEVAGSGYGLTQIGLDYYNTKFSTAK